VFAGFGDGERNTKFFKLLFSVTLKIFCINKDIIYKSHFAPNFFSIFEWVLFNTCYLFFIIMYLLYMDISYVWNKIA
jgi:hypothetical protein